MPISSEFSSVSEQRKDDLLLEAAEKNDLDAVRALLDANAHANVASPWDGKTALHYAARHDNPEMAKLLIAHGADVNHSDNDCRTPLFSAIRGKAVAEVLLDHGAFPNASTMQGWTALHEAVDGGKVEMTKLLLARGADPLHKDITGETPQKLAERRGNKDVLAAFTPQQRTAAAAAGNLSL